MKNLLILGAVAGVVYLAAKHFTSSKATPTPADEQTPTMAGAVQGAIKTVQNALGNLGGKSPPTSTDTKAVTDKGATVVRRSAPLGGVDIGGQPFATIFPQTGLSAVRS